MNKYRVTRKGKTVEVKESELTKQERINLFVNCCEAFCNMTADMQRRFLDETNNLDRFKLNQN